MLDGTEFELSPNDAFDVRQATTRGRLVMSLVLRSSGRECARRAGFPTGIRSRVLGTLLFTDLVASTETAAMLGDSRWRELLSTHFKAARAELELRRSRGQDEGSRDARAV